MSPNARLRRTHPALATRAVRHGRHAAGAPACHVALVVGAALLATTGAATAQRAEDFIGPTITLVRKSNERIVGDFMDVRKLPKTISIDPLTEAEVRDIQHSVYGWVMSMEPGTKNSWERSPFACMQWVFLRHQPDEPWQTISAVGGVSLKVLKINGAFRFSSDIRFEIPNTYINKKTWFTSYQEQVPGPGPGSGAITLTGAGGGATYAEALARMSEFDHHRGVELDTKPGNRVFSVLVLTSKAVRVLDQEVPCTHLKARCRRYVGKAQRETHYSYFQDDAARRPGGQVSKLGRVVLDPSLNTEVAIEDMCPFSHMAMVQRPLGARLSGGTGIAKKLHHGQPGAAGRIGSVL